MKKIITMLLSITSISSVFAANETYIIDPNHTFPRFEYSHFGFSNQIGRFDKTSGIIILDKAAKTGQIDIKIDMSSVNTGVALLNEHLQGEDFFSSKQYPIATFKSNKVTYQGEDPKLIDGELTIKGTTKPVQLVITSFKCMPHPMTKKDACGANVLGKIKRADFNMGKHIPSISDDVILSIAVEASK